jgi:hypothetical protein
MVAIITPENLGRGFALGTATPGKVELDLGVGLAFSGNKLAPVARRCLFVRRASTEPPEPEVESVGAVVGGANQHRHGE